MNYYEVSPLGIVRADSAYFTYSSKSKLETGSIVKIEIGNKLKLGVVIAHTTKPAYETKAVQEVVEPKPLPKALVDLALWISEYYSTHLGVVWQTFLPQGLDKNRRSRQKQAHKSIRQRTNFVLNRAQQSALAEIDKASSGTVILHGITGSGKTAVYIEAAKKAIARGESIIILTPEIGLTSQLVDDFSSHFENILLTHSRQTEAERHMVWKKALNSQDPTVAIGPRSALFLPLHKVGLIVIDEAHEPSYKQEQSPRYSALRAASVLAGKHGCKLILGSATPLVADYSLAQKNNRPIVKITQTARKTTKPKVSIVDMTKHDNFKKHRFLSDKLLAGIEKVLAGGQQILIFHNRRGSASVTLCENCGWQAGCARCFVPMTLHSDKHQLRCHICGTKAKVPTSCPDCDEADIVHKGIGTKLIESELRKIFPDKNIQRFDGDSAADSTISTKYDDLYSGKIDIIIGTQVVAKGLDLPKLGLVGVVQADAGLSLPDYGASERTFQLLAQAVGRVGRDSKDSGVIIQSYQPNNPAVELGVKQNYDDFCKLTLAERRRANFPPYCHLLKLVCVYRTEAAAIRNARQLATKLRQELPNSVEILGPTPTFYERQHDTYRWQLVLKSSRRQELSKALKHLPSKGWQFELDPSSLL